MLEGNLVTQLFEGVPAYSELRKILYEARKDGHSLAIFDDARESFATLDPIFTVGYALFNYDSAQLLHLFSSFYFRCSSYHLKAWVICLTQRLFDEGPHLKVISDNATYHILLRSLRNNRSVATLASQISTSQASHIVQSYRKATQSKYGYLIIGEVFFSPKELSKHFIYDFFFQPSV